MTEYYIIDETSFKKTVLLLQVTRDESKSAAQLREETGVANIEKFIDLLISMGYLKVIEGKGITKYRAVMKFQRIKEI